MERIGWKNNKEMIMWDDDQRKKDNDKLEALAAGTAVAGIIALAFWLLRVIWRNPISALVIIGLLYVVSWVMDWQVSRKTDGINVAAAMHGSCNAGQISVLFENTRTETIEAIGVRLRGFKPNHSESVASKYESFDRIIGPGTSWRTCVVVDDLGGMQAGVVQQLNWQTEISSIRFAE